MTYTLLPVPGFIFRDVDSVTIPPDVSNRDYQDYLTWVMDGNSPTPYLAPVNQQANLAAIIEHKARKLELRGDYLQAYLLRSQP